MESDPSENWPGTDNGDVSTLTILSFNNSETSSGKDFKLLRACLINNDPCRTGFGIIEDKIVKWIGSHYPVPGQFSDGSDSINQEQLQNMPLALISPIQHITDNMLD